MIRVACIRCDTLYLTVLGLPHPHLCAHCFAQLPTKLKQPTKPKSKPKPKKEPDHGPDPIR